MRHFILHDRMWRRLGEFGWHERSQFTRSSVYQGFTREEEEEEDKQNFDRVNWLLLCQPNFSRQTDFTFGLYDEFKLNIPVTPRVSLWKPKEHVNPLEKSTTSAGPSWPIKHDSDSVWLVDIVQWNNCGEIPDDLSENSVYNMAGITLYKPNRQRCLMGDKFRKGGLIFTDTLQAQWCNNNTISK